MTRAPAATLLAIALGLTLAVASRGTLVAEEPPLDCSECHTCRVPTAHEPCLKSCPRTVMVHQTAKHDMREAPGSMLIDGLASLYQPVRFEHRTHAGMAAMGLDCATCHHFSPPGRIPPCSACHEPSGKSTDLSKPNLKGAYHRQCLACHREWSHDTQCSVCHSPADHAQLSAAPADPTDIVGRTHPVVAVPNTRVYTTPYPKGPVVTFQHREHVDLFQFQCTDCHRDESCANCHDLQREQQAPRAQEEVHAICNDCHRQDPCSKCHDTRERPGFSHNQTGWPLAQYHQSLDCWSCHPKGKRMARLDRMCRSCHADWTPGTFRHAVTGLRLDEVHGELDCDACHADHRYEEPPSCNTCHDDGRTAATAPPGVMAAHGR